MLNCELIEMIELTPDTVISLINGDKIMVTESPEEIVERILQFKRAIHCPEELHRGARQLHLIG